MHLLGFKLYLRMSRERNRRVIFYLFIMKVNIYTTDILQNTFPFVSMFGNIFWIILYTF